MTDATVKDNTRTAGQAAAKGAVSAASGAGGWPVDDISGLARRLPEIDPASYFDGQAMGAFQQSLIKWPVLARLMKLVPGDDVASPSAHDPARAFEAE
ncbi:hypothetical protein [Paraburkholderia ginsengisoli]|jgi:hypothetical protein|uniref:hypothetical protein n=1 Tax=Paraburkholderia ginsengisoli TaxID=311231 RepID=UPI001E35B763|nr:hypothetical protein [Paraburkholderia ginsengisoli]